MPMFSSAIAIILNIVIVSVFSWDFYRSTCTLASTAFKGIEPVDNYTNASKYVDNQEFLVTNSLSL